ncbi:MAG: type II toxin-antitoxin system VapB family antitoxin [Rhodospirillales bacterium]
MALSIKAGEADLLARRLARLTGESMTDAVTVALRERLAREEARLASAGTYTSRVADLAARLRAAYDTRPVSKAEWDAASGEP